MERWGEVIKVLVNTDNYLKHVIAKGEWVTIISRNSILAMKDIINTRTLIVYKVRANGKIYYRYHIENKILTKTDILNIVDKLRGYRKSDILNTKINVKKYLKKRALREHESRVKKHYKIRELIEIFEKYVKDYEEELRKLRYKRDNVSKKRRKRLKEQIKACKKHIRRLKKQLKEDERELLS